MVEIYVVPEYNPNYFALLTGRWYVAPNGDLCFEVETKTYSFFGLKKEVDRKFINEARLREINGELCV